jgi:hypothetical protein
LQQFIFIETAYLLRERCRARRDCQLIQPLLLIGATQLFGLLLARGADFRWCDEARVDEWLPAERLRPAWLLRRAFRAGSALGRIRRRRPVWPAALPHALAALASALVLLPPAAAMGRAHRLRSAMRVCGAAGRVFGLLGGRYEEYK